MTMEVEITQTTTVHKTVTKVTKTEKMQPMEITSEMSKTKLFGKDLSEYDEVDIDALLDQLSPEELELLAADVDPDDSCVPPSDRCAYKCNKLSTGPVDRKKLINHINQQALNEPDRPELVPYVAGVIRGKKYIPPLPLKPEIDEDSLDQQVEVDLDEEFESVLSNASEDEIVDLAAILGFHSMMNQDQYHASLLNKGKPLGVGWGGVTKATKFKAMPAEPPNDTDVEISIKRISSDDSNCKDLNFNNIQTISDDQIKRLFKAVESNTRLEYLSMSNTCLSDRHLDYICPALEINSTLKTLNLETNNITTSGIVRIMEAILKMHSVEEIRLANQRQGVLGNKIEMQLTEIIERNPSVLRVGVHFEFNDARNRVSRHLQKNLDTFRIGILPRRPRQKPSTDGASLRLTLPTKAKGLPNQAFPDDYDDDDSTLDSIDEDSLGDDDDLGA